MSSLISGKKNFFRKKKDLFGRYGRSIHHVLKTKFKYTLCPIQEKGRRIPIQVQEKRKKRFKSWYRTGILKNCASDCFIAPIIIVVKKDASIKLALDAKPINRQLFKNKYQMPNVEELIDGVSWIVSAKAVGTLNVTVFDLKYAYSQLKLTTETA